jgi:hypothetical protein
MTASGEYRVHEDADHPGLWIVKYRPVKDDGPWMFVGRGPQPGVVMDEHIWSVYYTPDTTTPRLVP